jgi:hypothetical protein
VLNGKVEVIKDINYSYSNIIKVGEIVEVIHIYNDDMILIETSNGIRVKILKDKVQAI